jgi:hypothetical protein
MHGRLIALSSLAAALALGWASPASANHHLVSVTEVFPGSTARGADAEFVELQFYAAGQNNFTGAGQTVRFYDAAGNPDATEYTFALNPPFGGDQRTFLLSTPAAVTSFGVANDAGLLPNEMSPAGGAVCFTSTAFGTIDCATWGNFTGANPPPTAGGPPAAPGGIPDEQSISRDISRGCATRLEGSFPPLTGADDTGSSQVDFVAAAPTPRNNSTVPTETPCGAPPGVTPITSIAPVSPPKAPGRAAKKKCKKAKKGAAAAAKCKKKKKK